MPRSFVTNRVFRSVFIGTLAMLSSLWTFQPLPAATIGTVMSTSGTMSMTGGGTTMITCPGTCKGTWLYDPPPGDLSGPQDVEIHFSDVISPQQPFDNAMGTFTQNGYSGVMAIIRTTPANEGDGSRTNILTSEFINASLSGAAGSQTLDLIASNNNLTYSSDFITDLGDSTSRIMDITFHLGKPLASPNDLGEFSASSIDGVFSVEPGPVQFVPEPSSIGLLGVGLGGVICVWGRKRRAV
jgi:hypothetical protein